MYGCQVADVAVDTRTGKVTLLDITAVHDVGKVVNRVGFEGQVYGGVVQGMIGYGMLEDFNIENGEVKSENFDTYLLPTIRDIPNIRVIAVENHDRAGPYGAKVIGEPVLKLGGAALNNAVSFAVGRWNRTLPLTLEQVRLGYNLKNRRGRAKRKPMMVNASKCFVSTPLRSAGPPICNRRWRCWRWRAHRHWRAARMCWCRHV